MSRLKCCNLNLIFTKYLVKFSVGLQPDLMRISYHFLVFHRQYSSQILLYWGSTLTSCLRSVLLATRQAVTRVWSGRMAKTQTHSGKKWGIWKALLPGNVDIWRKIVKFGRKLCLFVSTQKHMLQEINIFQAILKPPYPFVKVSFVEKVPIFRISVFPRECRNSVF